MAYVHIIVSVANAPMLGNLMPEGSPYIRLI
jgi:hypothetical protein